MILSQAEIKSLILTHDMVAGFEEANLQAFGLDITASSEAFVEAYSPSSQPAVFPIKHGKSAYNVEKIDLEQDPLVILPQSQVAVYSKESFKLPTKIRGRCYTTASMSVCGVSFVGDIVLHPGWEGHILVYIRNNNRHHSVKIDRGDCIGQVQFESVPEQQYRYAGNFQHLGVKHV